MSEKINKDWDKKTNLNISNFGINKGKLKTIGSLNIPKHKEDIDFVFEQNPELINILYNSFGYTLLSNDEKKELYELLRMPLFNKIRNTTEYEKYNGNTLPAHEFSEENFNLLITGIEKNNIDTDRILYELERTKELFEKYDIIKEGELFSYFDPKTGNLNGFTSQEEKKLSLEKAKYHINLFRFFKEPEIKTEAKKIYTEYLKTIFPESKIKKINYHGTSSIFEGDRFNKSKLGSSTEHPTSKLGFYFVPDKKVSDIFIKGRKYKRKNGKIEVILPENARTLCTLLNIKNPEYIEGDIFQEYAEKNQIPPLKLDGDSVIITPQTKNILPEFSCENYIVFEPEQIHVLGSEQDIRQLREWLGVKK